MIIFSTGGKEQMIFELQNKLKRTVQNSVNSDSDESVEKSYQRRKEKTKNIIQDKSIKKLNETDSYFNLSMLKNEGETKEKDKDKVTSFLNSDDDDDYNNKNKNNSNGNKNKNNNNDKKDNNKDNNKDKNNNNNHRSTADNRKNSITSTSSGSSSLGIRYGHQDEKARKRIFDRSVCVGGGVRYRNK